MDIRAILAACLLMGAAALCPAESSSSNYILERSVIGSAGGNATSTNFIMDSTLGQPTPIGQSDSTNYVLGAGFWYGKIRLPGDANGDCAVNILDMIWIRNRLRQDVDTGDNWTADVKEDGSINILDLIFARNHLGWRCAQ